MEWLNILAIVMPVILVMIVGIFFNNRRIDDLRSDMNQRFIDMNESINQRFADMNQRFIDMNQRLVEMNQQISDLRTDLHEIKNHIIESYKKEAGYTIRDK